MCAKRSHIILPPDLPRLRTWANPPKHLATWLIDIEQRALVMGVTDTEVIETAKQRARKGGRKRDCLAIIDANATQFTKEIQVRRYLKARGFWTRGNLSFSVHGPERGKWWTYADKTTVTVYLRRDLDEEWTPERQEILDKDREWLRTLLAGTDAHLYEESPQPAQPPAYPLTSALLLWPARALATVAVAGTDETKETTNG